MPSLKWSFCGFVFHFFKLMSEKFAAELWVAYNREATRFADVL
ncbi:hypothetical protein [Piscirickettsia salmonis]|nr:hypothetical protein [Piscirickettsia salmonis]